MQLLYCHLSKWKSTCISQLWINSSNLRNAFQQHCKTSHFWIQSTFVVQHPLLQSITSGNFNYLFHKNSEIHDHYAWSSKSYHQGSVQTTTRQHGIAISGPLFWNSLPIELTSPFTKYSGLLLLCSFVLYPCFKVTINIFVHLYLFNKSLYDRWPSWEAVVRTMGCSSLLFSIPSFSE